ncbi:nucleotide exchange factor GrpE [Corticibacter populi]|uniref:Protein GrpE n=1 Tax=Corticibacter populi TaxID=1550736 RepID=A0A3M6QVE4_9BURK|nr:nucleotide exchange factor GrpE [Corticibacter populi]RMX06529.1 nucleotide exchange factor GrpE [Corticibacter populi]RZS31908.1 molecular chaperone GrpE [Corticibacter populi]
MSETEKTTAASHQPGNTPDQFQARQTEPDVNEELAGLHAEVEALRTQLGEQQALKAQNTELSEQYLRAKADAENARRRAEEDVSKARKFGIESFAHDLLAVADSLDAALAIESASAEQLLEGTRATQSQLQSVFERHKLHTIAPAVGDKFDPHHHQAISAVPADQAPNTIVGVLQKGYAIGERVLRPALVTVAAER